MPLLKTAGSYWLQTCSSLLADVKVSKERETANYRVDRLYIAGSLSCSLCFRRVDFCFNAGVTLHLVHQAFIY